MGTAQCTCSKGELHKDQIVAPASVKDQLRRQRSRKGTEESMPAPAAVEKASEKAAFASEKTSQSSASTSAGSDSEQSAYASENPESAEDGKTARKSRTTSKGAPSSDGPGDSDMAAFKEHLKKSFSSRDSMVEALGDQVDLTKFQEFLAKVKFESADGGKRLFATMDKNESGTLKKQEVIDALKANSSKHAGEAAASPAAQEDDGKKPLLKRGKSSIKRGKSEEPPKSPSKARPRRMSLAGVGGEAPPAIAPDSPASPVVKRRGSTSSVASEWNGPEGTAAADEEDEAPPTPMTARGAPKSMALEEGSDHEAEGAAAPADSEAIKRFKSSLKPAHRQKAWQDFLAEHRMKVEFRDFSRLLDVKLGHDKAYIAEVWAQIDRKQEGHVEGCHVKQLFADEVPVAEKEAKAKLSRRKSTLTKDETAKVSTSRRMSVSKKAGA